MQDKPADQGPAADQDLHAAAAETRPEFPKERLDKMVEAAKDFPPITVGRIVHFHHNVHGTVENLAAIVTKVWSGTCCNLKVFAPGGDFPVTSATKATTYGQDGYWSYPPRV